MKTSRHQGDDSFEKFAPYGLALFLLAMGSAHLSAWYFKPTQPAPAAISATKALDHTAEKYILIEDVSWGEIGASFSKHNPSLPPVEPDTAETLLISLMAKEEKVRGTNS